MTIATQTRPVWTGSLEAPPVSTPFEFGAWCGERGGAAHAAFWYARKSEMIDYLAGYLGTHTADDNHRRAAQELFEQLTQTDGMSNEQWRFGQ